MQFYSSGKTSGTLIGLGHKESYVIPIIDGQQLNYAYKYSNLSGDKITKDLMQFLNVNYGNAHLIKHRLLGNEGLQGQDSDFSLPDGRVINHENIKQFGAMRFSPMRAQEKTIP